MIVCSFNGGTVVEQNSPVVQQLLVVRVVQPCLGNPKNAMKTTQDINKSCCTIDFECCISRAQK